MASLTRLVLLVLALPCLSGCQDTGPAAEESLPAPPEPSPWGEDGRVELYSQPDGDRLVALNLCTDPDDETSSYERNGALVPPGTGSLAIQVRNDDVVPPYQVGTRVDGGEVAWLEPVSGGTRHFVVPVGADQAETEEGGYRWEFLYRYSMAPGMGCYAGPVFADHPVRIEAVHGAS